MSDVYNGMIYMDNRVMFDELRLTEVLEITEDIANNPTKLANLINMSFESLTIILLANSITKPYEELYVGRLIAIPEYPNAVSQVKYASSSKADRDKAKPVLNLKQAKLTNNKISF